MHCTFVYLGQRVARELCKLQLTRRTVDPKIICMLCAHSSYPLEMLHVNTLCSSSLPELVIVAMCRSGTSENDPGK